MRRRALGAALAFALLMVIVPGRVAVARAQESEPVWQPSQALEREYELRSWALALAGEPDSEAALAAWRAACVSTDWGRQRAALVAVRRAPRLADPEAALAALRAGLASGYPSVVEAALAGVERRGWFARLAADPASEAALLASAEAQLPAVRSRLAWAAARLEPPVALGSLDERLGLRLEILGALIDDEDPAVRADARRALLLMETPLELEFDAPDAPAAALFAARTSLLHRLVESGRFDELVVSLELLSRAVAEPRADLALSTWASQDAPAMAAGLGLDEMTVRGLVEAVILVRGGHANGALVARAFADWVLVRTSFDLELNLDSWALIDRLLRAGAEGPGDAVAEALFDEAWGAMLLYNEVGLDQPWLQEIATRMKQASGGAWARAQAAGREGDLSAEEFERHLFAAVATGRPAEQALELFMRRSWINRQFIWFLEQFTSGLAAGELHELERFFGLPGRVGIPFTWYYGERGVEPGALQAFTDALAIAFSSRPDAATERLLLDVLDNLDAESPYWSIEEQRFATAFRAICGVRYATRAGLGPAGLMPAEELFQRMSSSMTALWNESDGVRLDLLSKLPHVPEMEAFAPLLTVVGDTGGVLAPYRGACVELLGACRGNEAVHATLVSWLDAELASRAGDEVLLRVDELELAGFARAIASNGTSLGLGEEHVWELLELAIERGRRDGVAKELGKAAIMAAAGYADGAARLDARFLRGERAERAERERRLRIEAALQVLALEDLAPAVEERAVRALIADFEFAGWDLAPRLAAALGKCDLGIALDALVAESAAHTGLEVPVEAVSLLDALVAVAKRRSDARPVVVAALLHTLVDGRALELRGAAITRLVPLLDETGDAQLFESLESLVFSREVAKSSSTARPEAQAANGPAIPFGLGALTADERQYLRDKATVALADRIEDGSRLGRVLFESLRTDGSRELELRWRGELPKGGAFEGRTALEVFAARGDRAQLLARGWERVDARFILSLAVAAEGCDPELAARLFDAALVALGGEPNLDLEAWTEVATRRLGLAWQAGDWRTAGDLADELSWRRRQSGLSRSALGRTLGSHDATLGIDPRARIESLRFQAAAHLADQMPERTKPLIRRAAELVGSSTAAATDQAQL